MEQPDRSALCFIPDVDRLGRWQEHHAALPSLHVGDRFGGELYVAVLAAADA
jgi:hypothetical protein